MEVYIHRMNRIKDSLIAIVFIKIGNPGCLDNDMILQKKTD